MLVSISNDSGDGLAVGGVRFNAQDKILAIRGITGLRGRFEPLGKRAYSSSVTGAAPPVNARTRGSPSTVVVLMPTSW